MSGRGGRGGRVSFARGMRICCFPYPPPAPKRSKRACCRLGAVAPKRQHALYSSGVGGLLPIRATVEKPWLSSFAALRSSAAGSPAPARSLPRAKRMVYGLPTSSTKRLPDIVDKRTKRTVHFSLGTVLIAVKGVSRHASIVLRRARQFTVALAPASPVEPAPISSGPGHVA